MRILTTGQRQVTAHRGTAGNDRIREELHTASDVFQKGRQYVHQHAKLPAASQIENIQLNKLKWYSMDNWKMKYISCPLTLVFLAAFAVEADAGQFEFASPAVAGAAGGNTAPLLFVGFRGDGETTDAQVEFVYDNTRFTPQLTPRNGALCLASGDRVLIVSPGSAAPLTGNLVRYCEIRFAIAAGTSGGSHDFDLDESTIECAGSLGPPPTCTAPSGIGVIRVGPNSPQAQFLYAPLPGTTVLLDNALGEISADFLSGGFGAAIELHNCQITPQSGAIFGPVVAAPQPLAFVSNLTGTGLLGLSCTRQVADTAGQLSCMETRNGTIPAKRIWNLLCPALPPEQIFENGFEIPTPP